MFRLSPICFRAPIRFAMSRSTFPRLGQSGKGTDDRFSHPRLSYCQQPPIPARRENFASPCTQLRWRGSERPQSGEARGTTFDPRYPQGSSITTNLTYNLIWKKGGGAFMQSGQAKPLLRALAGEALSLPPWWLIRQAGRYLPEYRQVRAKASDFIELCLTPALAADLTLQPIRRYGMDGAILFSDILMLPYALGQKLAFHEG